MKKDTLAVIQDAADWLYPNVVGIETKQPLAGFKRIRVGTWIYEYGGRQVIVLKKHEDEWYWSHSAHVDGILREIDGNFAKTLDAACAAALKSIYCR